MNRVITWKLVLATLIAYLFSAGFAYADNYNFYFTKPGKKARQGTELNVPGDSEADEDGSDNVDEPEPEQVKKSPLSENTGSDNPAENKSAPLSTSQTGPNTQTLTIPGTQQPIIINNTNHVGYPISAASVPPEPSPEPAFATKPEPLPSPTPAADTAPNPPSKVFILPSFRAAERSNWRMGFSATLLTQQKTVIYNAYGGEAYSYTANRESFGGLITLGWDLTRVIGFNLYGGATASGGTPRFSVHYGGDIQLMPLRIPLRNFELIEFGILAGASTFFSDQGGERNLHAGAKLNVNFGQNFGFTAAGRTNLDHFLIEAGLVARI